jgi:hypothetical protein
LARIQGVLIVEAQGVFTWLHRAIAFPPLVVDGDRNATIEKRCIGNAIDEMVLGLA